ncbi:MAG TPA: hypothetical protein DDZ89_19205, partial [Clostridiales bacterium]|nr:hypothetical protein [Clostridiales bacterium]
MKKLCRSLRVCVTGVLVLLLIGSSGCSEQAPTDEDHMVQTGYVSRSLYTDSFVLHNALEVLKYEYEQGVLSEEQTAQNIEAFIRELEGSDNFKDYYSVINKQKKGKTYGAIPDENPIGGGIGYEDIIKKGKYNVSTADELVDALKKVKSGDTIFVNGEAKIDMTDFCMAENYVITLPDNVILASDRGYEGSKGGMIYTTAIRSRPLIQAGNNVRITGLVIQGPDPMIRDWKNKAMGTGISSENDGLTVDNCEISGFNDASVKLSGGENHVIRYNYIHHNRSINAGHGVFIQGATALIENNLFNYNRNSVAGTHTQGTGLEVRNNIFLDVADEVSVI